MEPKQVIVLRKDLGMRKGKMCAQAASMKVIIDRMNREYTANGNYFYSFYNRMGSPIDIWLRNLFTKIVVGCDSEQELLELYSKAKEKNILCALITDSGKTEFHEIPTHTALAIGPDEPEKIDEITGHLKLL